MKKSLLLLFLFCITGLLSGVVLSITPFQTASTFVSKINSSTTESYPVPVFSAVATQCQAGGELGLAIDGSMATMYHSDWGGKSLPDTLDFTFMDVPRIDSVIYYPRKVGTSANGDFGNTEIWVANKTNPNAFIKLIDKDFGMLSSVTKLALNGAEGLLNPAIIRFIVKTGRNNFASCAEMEFKTTVQIPPKAEPCDPGVNILPDIKQTVSSGTATSYQSNENIDKSFDGNSTTLYHSNYNGGGFPITLNYNFTNVDKIDYLVYNPRSDGGNNGLFQAVEVWYSTKDAPTSFTKTGDYNFNAATSASKVSFATPIVNPATVRMVVKGGLNNFASCAEMEFYKTVGFAAEFPATIFRDSICSWLKQTVNQADIDNMSDGFYKSLAQCMFNGTYDSVYHVQSYEPYPEVSTTAAALKTSNYCLFENPTGIYLEAGKVVIVFVEDTYGQNISLKVYDYSSGKITYYQLNTGLNKLSINSSGLVYIDYFTNNYASLKPVKMNISSGKINGYYDVQKTSSYEWKSLLQNTVTGMIDLKGKYINMIFPVAQLKTYCANDGKDLVQIFDSVVRIEHEQMGLYKYNRVPKNHMAAEADNNTWSWYAGGKGAHFSGGLNSILNPKTLDLWGIAHELGHINQTRPGLKWTGTTEVTNNIHSAYVIYLLTPNNCRLEKEQTNDAYYSGIETGTGSGKSNSMIGGRFNAYLNNAIMKSQVWLFQYGSDNVKTASAESDWTVGGDFFVRFAPMWQLTLYYNVARPDKKDWWGDVAEKVRNTNESGLNGGKLQVNFMKNTCDAVGEDLTDFFRNAGMLRTFSKNVDDYGVANITLTAADSASVVSYVATKGYPKPESPVIYYLSANNVHVFRDKLALEGTTGAGCSPVLTAANDYQKYVTIDHAVWKNAVVFETYAGAELVRISMVGSGYANNSKTRVYFPNNATSIYAVAWDGSKKLVYGEANKITENYNKNISITPNPTNEKIQMNGFKGSANFILTDLSGKKLMSQTILENESVPVSFLSNGIYIGHIVTSEGNASKKIIKN